MKSFLILGFFLGFTSSSFAETYYCESLESESDRLVLTASFTLDQFDNGRMFGPGEIVYKKNDERPVLIGLEFTEIMWNGGHVHGASGKPEPLRPTIHINRYDHVRGFHSIFEVGAEPDRSRITLECTLALENDRKILETYK